MSLELNILILMALLGLSGFFSGVETALFSLDSTQVRRMVKEKKRGALAVQRLRSKPQRLLITILIGNNLVNIGASSFATFVALNVFGSVGLSYAIGVMTFLILIFGEIVPKSFSTTHNELISGYASGVIEFLTYILFPVVWVCGHHQYFCVQISVTRMSVRRDDDVVFFRNIPDAGNCCGDF